MPGNQFEFLSYHFGHHDDPVMMEIEVAFTRVDADDYEISVTVYDTMAGKFRSMNDFPAHEFRAIDAIAHIWAENNAADEYERAQEARIDSNIEAYQESLRDRH